MPRGIGYSRRSRFSRRRRTSSFRRGRGRRRRSKRLGYYSVPRGGIRL